MEFETRSIPGVILCKPDVFRDARGLFQETWNEARYRGAGIDLRFVQDNRSISAKGVLRGLHFQRDRPQAKLVSCIHGAVFDVAVDIRPGSATFGEWTAAELTEDNAYQMLIPAGFAHGFCVLSETAEIFYKCTEFYNPDDDRGLLWSDPRIAVAWPVKEPLLSAKDRIQPLLAELEQRGELPRCGGVAAVCSP